MLATWSADRLADYIVKLAATDDDVRRELEEQAAVQADDVRELIRGARQEIRRRTAEEVWANHWSGEGNLPAYGGVERRLERLFEAEQYDALLDLGRELFDLGRAQVESSNDEGETATAITRCLEVVARAVPGVEPAAGRTTPVRHRADGGGRLRPGGPIRRRGGAPVAEGGVVRGGRPAAGRRAAGGLGRTSLASGTPASGRTGGSPGPWTGPAGGQQLLPFLEAEAAATGNYPELVHKLLAGRAGRRRPPVGPGGDRRHKSRVAGDRGPVARHPPRHGGAGQGLADGGRVRRPAVLRVPVGPRLGGDAGRGEEGRRRGRGAGGGEVLRRNRQAADRQERRPALAAAGRRGPAGPARDAGDLARSRRGACRTGRATSSSSIWR